MSGVSADIEADIEAEVEADAELNDGISVSNERVWGMVVSEPFCEMHVSDTWKKRSDQPKRDDECVRSMEDEDLATA